MVVSMTKKPLGVPSCFGPQAIMKVIRSEIKMRIELKFEDLDMKKPPQRDIEICLAAYSFLRLNAN